MKFRTRLFLTSLAAAGVTLLVATLLSSYWVGRTAYERTERSLVAQARLAAELMSQHIALAEPGLDTEADALGRFGSARVTFIAHDGRVVGDSEVAAAELPALENHGARE